MKLTNSLFSILALVYLASCYPKGPEVIQDLDIVITDRSPEFDFATSKTYFLIDTINWITNDRNFVPDKSFESQIMAEISSQLAARNYLPVTALADTNDLTNPANPDLILTVAAVYSNNTGTTWYPSYGWGWGWGWGWGGGYGAWYPVSYSYTTGSLIIDMGDFKSGNKLDRKFPLVWEAGMNGVASSSTSNNQQRILGGIDQAFEQSPYIIAN